MDSSRKPSFGNRGHRPLPRTCGKPLEEHNPRTPTERILVENVAAARWRQWRIWGMQKVAFDHEVASPSTTNDPPLRAVLAWKNSADTMRTHELLLRYEIALDRQISRSLLRLQQLQAKPALKEAKRGRHEPLSLRHQHAALRSWRSDEMR